jgi:hypothetical protein
MNEPTVCKQCDRVEESSRKRRPTQWLCTAFPRKFAEGFVDPDWWIENEPYQRCMDINRGCCPMFEKVRDKK